MTVAADAFASLIGPAHVREADGADGFAGVSPSLVVEPADEAEVASVLREASAAGLRVVVRGGGSKLEWGAPPEACDVILSTRRLDGLVEHAAGDLICVAGAGMRLADLQSALARAQGHRQQLMLDPPDPAATATLGGTVATGASGPLRTRYGTPRDLLIGVRFVLADGTVGHAGGKVVKNVAGYDLGKLLTGSLGTLAVITQVALRLHPRQPCSLWVRIEETAPAAMAARLECLRQLPVTPSCVDVLWPEGVGAIRIDSSESGADRQAGLVTERLGGRVLELDEGASLAASLAPRPWQGEGVVAGVAVPRTRVAELLDASGKYADELVLRGPLGAGELRLKAEPGRVSALRDSVQRLGGHLVLRRASAALRDEVWPAAAGPELELMRAIKRSLDPDGILAPGRHLGGI